MAASVEKAHPLKARRRDRKPEEDPEENKTKKEAKKRFRWNGEEDEAGRRQQNQIGVFTPFSDRRRQNGKNALNWP